MAYRRRRRGLLGLFGFKKKRDYSRFDGLRLGGRFGLDWGLSEETKRGIFIIILFVLAALSLLGLFDLSGQFGQWVVRVLSLLFGGLSWLFPILAILFAYFLLRTDKYQVRVVNYVGAILFILGITALWHLRFDLFESVKMDGQGLGGG